MLVFRWIMLLLLLTSGLSFALFVVTGQARYKQFGLRILKWTVFAGFVFFGVLTLERIA